MKWAERVRVKSSQSTMYDDGAGANARVLMIEAAAADVSGVTWGGGTETSIAVDNEICWDGIWRCVAEFGGMGEVGRDCGGIICAESLSRRLIGEGCCLGGSKKSESEGMVAILGSREEGKWSSSGGVTERKR